MKPQIEILEYSEKAVAMFGETKQHATRLKELNGRFNPFLKHPSNGLTCAGWVFSKKQLAILESEFKSETKTEVPVIPVNVPAIPETELQVPEVPEIIADEQVMKQTRTRQAARKTKTETKTVSKVSKPINLKAAIKKAHSLLKCNSIVSVSDYFKLENGDLTVSDLETFAIFKTAHKETGLINRDIYIKTGIVNVSGEALQDYPLLPSDFKNETKLGIISRDDLDKMMTAVSYTGKDDLRPVFSQVYVSETEISGTDAHRLFWDKSSGELTGEVLFNKASIMILNETNETVNISRCGNWIKAKTESITVIFRECEGQFPKYQNVIPKDNPIKLTVNKKLLMETIKTAVVFGNKSTHLVRFNCREGVVTVSSEDLDFKTEFSKEIEAKINSEIEIGFNGNLLLEVLKTVDSEKAIIEMSAPNRAAIINGNRLLMPVMLNN